eukprot:CAMPEP_0117589530 /NCGR_PEP_ID=MMETSP0784-20121206/70462_1 /TAXON_ID=39447 /ORGANISM="" /LENGTH=57 /DNA_ID=CAMNT_0005391019 /DNA_START=658 /DNA_END=831 /DNA_ORIENTATION=+
MAADETPRPNVVGIGVVEEQRDAQDFAWHKVGVTDAPPPSPQLRHGSSLKAMGQGLW